MIDKRKCCGHKERHTERKAERDTKREISLSANAEFNFYSIAAVAVAVH